MKELKIEKFMTHSPHTINSGVALKTAKEMMKKYGIRHLPVQVGGHLVGVLTERDLLLASTFDKKGELLVTDAMTPDPYAVEPDASLGEVVEKMATNKYGCAVVKQEDGRVIGIFTALDGLRLIGDQINTPKRAKSGTRKAAKPKEKAKAKPKRRRK